MRQPIIACLCLVAIASASPAIATQRGASVEAASSSERNRELVRAAFDRWRAGQGDPFSLLTDDMTWTISGFDPAVARTYRGKTQFLDQTVRPFAARMQAPLKPTVRGLWSDGDHVLVHWEGETVAKDGEPYRNSYLWIFRMRQDRVVAVTAFLDNAAFKAVFDRMPVAPEPR